MGVSWSSRSDRRRPLIASRTMRRLAAPVTCGGRRGPLSLAATSRRVARMGAGRPARRPVPTPSHQDALTALAVVHCSVVAHLSAQPTRHPAAEPPTAPPSRTRRSSRPPAA